MTVAHGFTDQPELYYVVDGKKPLFPFVYANKPREKGEPDIAIVPIGEMDAEHQNLIVKINGLCPAKIHFHKTNPA